MNTKTIYLIVGLFVLIILGMIIFTMIAQRNINSTTPGNQTGEIPLPTNPYGIERIDAKYFYINGVHTIVGMLSLPTPCDLLEGTAQVAESMPEQITFEFDVINTSDMCAQVVTEQRFRIDATASENASLQVRFMGMPVELNLIQASESESPEDFELFMKG